MRSSSAVLRVTAALALMLAMLTGVFGVSLQNAAAQEDDELQAAQVATLSVDQNPAVIPYGEDSIVVTLTGTVDQNQSAYAFYHVDCDTNAVIATIATGGAIAANTPVSVTNAFGPGTYCLLFQTSIPGFDPTSSNVVTLEVVDEEVVYPELTFAPDEDGVVNDGDIVTLIASGGTPGLPVEIRFGCNEAAPGGVVDAGALDADGNFTTTVQLTLAGSPYSYALYAGEGVFSDCVTIEVVPDQVEQGVGIELQQCERVASPDGYTGIFTETDTEVFPTATCDDPAPGLQEARTFQVFNLTTGAAAGSPVTVGPGSTSVAVVTFFAPENSTDSFYVQELTTGARSGTFTLGDLSGVAAIATFLEIHNIAPAASEEPSASPSEEPSAAPSEEPSASPSEEPSAAPSEEPSAAPSASPVPGGTVAEDLVFTVGIICEDEDLAGQYLYLIDTVSAEEMDLNCRPAGEGEHTYFTARSSDASTIDEASTDENGTATLDGLYDENFFLYEDGDFNVPYGSDNIFVPSEGDGVIITPAEVGQVNVVVVEFVEPGEEPSESPSASPSETPATPSAAPSEAPSAAPSEEPSAAPSAAPSAGGEVTELPNTGAGSTSSNAGLTFGLIGLVLAAAVAGVVVGLRKRTA